MRIGGPVPDQDFFPGSEKSPVAASVSLLVDIFVGDWKWGETPCGFFATLLLFMRLPYRLCPFVFRI